MNARVAVLLSGALSCACAVELALPAPPLPPPELEPPELVDFEPKAGHAGTRLSIEGKNFAADPGANLVYFPGGVVRGEGFSEEGALLARVPDDAGSGRLVVETPAGNAALEGFSYRGLGRLRYGRIVAEHPISHRPNAVAVANGRIAVLSGLTDDVLATGGAGTFERIGEQAGLLASNDAVGHYYLVPIAAPPRLLVFDAQGQEVATLELHEKPAFVLATGPGGADQLVLVWDGYGSDEGTSVQRFDAHTLAPLGARRTLRGIASFTSLDVLADGTLVGLASADDEDETGGVARVRPADQASFVAVEGLGFSKHALALDASKVFVLEGDARPVLVDTTTGEVGEPLEDYTGTLVDHAVAVRGPKPLFVAARCNASQVAAWTAEGALAWTSHHAPCPVRLTTDASGTRLFVADGRSNQVEVLDAATGTPLGKALFPIDPGGTPETGLVRTGDLLFMPSDRGRLLQMNLTDFEVRLLIRSHVAHQVATDGVSVWGFGFGENAFHLDAEGTASAFELEGPVKTARRLAEGGLLVNTSHEVMRIEGGEVVKQRAWDGELTLKQVLIAEPLPDGGAAVLRDLPADRIELWSAAALFESGTEPSAIAVPSLERNAKTQALIAREGRLLAALDDAALAAGLLFDDALVQISSRRSAVRFAEHFARTQGAGIAWADIDGRLHYGRITSEHDLVEDGALQLGGALRGLAWSPTGERAFVLVQGRDAVLELE